MSDFWRNTVHESEEDRQKLPITWKRLVKVGFHLWRQFDDPYYAGFAAQIAFFIMLSLVPTVIVVSQLLGVFRISIDMVDRWIDTQC